MYDDVNKYKITTRAFQYYGYLTLYAVLNIQSAFAEFLLFYNVKDLTLLRGLD